MVDPRPPEGTPQKSGQEPEPSRDHERRLRLLEAGQSKLTGSVEVIRLEQRSMRNELFGDPNRRDEGGRGAFASLERTITEQQHETTAKLGDLQSAVASAASAAFAAATTASAVAAANAQAASRRTVWSSRWVQFATYLAVGLIIAVATYVLALTHPGHP